MTSPATPASIRTCAACGERGSGRFCAACGASLAESTCAGCGAALSAGAKFCHRCGLAVGAPAPNATAAAAKPDRMGSVLPWAVAFVALLALAAMAAGRNFNATKPAADAQAAQAGQAPAIDPSQAPFAGGAGGVAGAGGARPPSLANMSPTDIADRLYDRVMRLQTEGKKDSAAFFATMALQNYAGMDSLDLDLRYDMGRIAEVAGQTAIARAQADTILQRNPTHLLGLVLAMRAATDVGDAKSAATFRSRLQAAEKSGERGSNLPEYERHKADIDDALKP